MDFPPRRAATPSVPPNATVGTAAASLLFPPGATMVAGPQIAPMACNYPDSVNTVTQLDLKKPVMRRRQTNFAPVRVTNTQGPAVPKVPAASATRGTLPSSRSSAVDDADPRALSVATRSG